MTPAKLPMKKLQQMIQNGHRLLFDSDGRTYEEFNDLAKTLGCNYPYSFTSDKFYENYELYPYHVFSKEGSTRTMSVSKGYTSTYVILDNKPQW
jgi:hypothetical protein